MNSELQNCQQTEPCTVEAVSYTHLDVYKRQDESNGLDYVLVGDY